MAFRVLSYYALLFLHRQGLLVRGHVWMHANAGSLLPANRIWNFVTTELMYILHSTVQKVLYLLFIPSVLASCQL